MTCDGQELSSQTIIVPQWSLKFRNKLQQSQNRYSIVSEHIHLPITYTQITSLLPTVPCLRITRTCMLSKKPIDALFSGSYLFLLLLALSSPFTPGYTSHIIHYADGRPFHEFWPTCCPQMILFLILQCFIQLMQNVKLSALFVWTFIWIFPMYFYRVLVYNVYFSLFSLSDSWKIKLYGPSGPHSMFFLSLCHVHIMAYFSSENTT